MVNKQFTELEPMQFEIPCFSGFWRKSVRYMQVSTLHAFLVQDVYVCTCLITFMVSLCQKSEKHGLSHGNLAML